MFLFASLMTGGPGVEQKLEVFYFVAVQSSATKPQLVKVGVELMSIKRAGFWGELRQSPASIVSRYVIIQ